MRRMQFKAISCWREEKIIKFISYYNFFRPKKPSPEASLEKAKLIRALAGRARKSITDRPETFPAGCRVHVFVHWLPPAIPIGSPLIINVTVGFFLA
mmetsp:Transcript_16695/g.16615  ORF Transcript_16695/g.16615 Transcript_16695/m.16615 type:complete len:97 (+) Transcript_16695:661-951(+)